MRPGIDVQAQRTAGYAEGRGLFQPDPFPLRILSESRITTQVSALHRKLLVEHLVEECDYRYRRDNRDAYGSCKSAAQL
ncbi:MAG: hypothetical protein AAGL66_18075, partial [Pseudomonadota bacterium]